MSSSSASSSSPSRRTPLHQRTNSENNKRQIRLVPYTPPKIDADETGSRAPDLESTGSHVAFRPTEDRTSSASTSLGRDRFISSSFSLPSSSSSPVTASTWVKGEGVSESRLVSDSSGNEHPAPPARAVLRTSHGSSIRQVNAPTRPFLGQHGNAPGLPPTPTRPASRRDRFISINSDKTFSLVRPTNTRVSAGSESTVKSYRHSNTSYFSSHEGTASETRTDDHSSSLFSSIAERSVSPSSLGASATPSKLTEEPVASSPWNYRMIGGLRKVQQTPDSKAKGKEREVVAEQLPLLPETTPPTARVPRESSALAPQSSFTTENSDSTFGDSANFRVIGRSSPPLPDSESIDVPSSSNSSNYRVHGQSSAPQSFASSPARAQSILDTPGSRNFVVHDSPYPASEQALLETPGSRNFVVHRDASPSLIVYPFPRIPRSQTSYPSSGPSSGQQTPEKYSQESLVIPPLRPHKRSSSDNLCPKPSPREIRHGRSTSFSSIHSVLTQDTGPNVVRLAHTPSASASSISSLRQSPWAGRSSGGPAKSRMDVHQWSSQLSPVLSEYEGSSDRASRLTSLGSRNVHSISSSILDNIEPARVVSHTHSRSGSFEQPGAAFMRGARELPTPPVRTIRDHDEHGDGLADLEQIHQLQSKSSRTRLGFLSRHSSDRSSRSTTSSRSRAGSLTVTSLPTWARLYYGSGERRWLASGLIYEGDDSRPASSWAPLRSPPPQQLSHDIHNPRRRPREPQHSDPSTSSPQPVLAVMTEIRRVPKKQTSSIWSPHLQPDRRSSHYSLWQPPSGTWSTENRVLGRRNIQLVLFVLGFIFPFAWMIAAVLPLPRNPEFDIPELKKSTAPFQAPDESGPGPLQRRATPTNDMRYHSARWWRNVNRCMSIVGLLILGAVAALIVVGIRQGWGK
ncbi:putative serine-rich protein [Rosellinia necatrix]|uniref:Putative serine-rich protein n=1 Tax=Rosellinia necatrix TaxID=77044 RepID=A0A1W2TEM8_ROSNE|nr:putative serine-rich protein [Rosellinia necatrix]